MRSLKAVALAVVCVLALVSMVAAKANSFGVSDVNTVVFSEPIFVGTTLLPQGTYQVRHTMEGETHIMVFRQLHVKNPAEARIKCNLVPLTDKATQTATLYTHNDAQQHILTELVFKGDTAKHVF